MVLVKRWIPWLCAITLLFTVFAFSVESGPGEIKTYNANLPNHKLVIKLLIWIDQNTDYDVTAIAINPPKIVFKAHGDAIDYEKQEIIFPEALKGLYDKERNLIYLEEHWDGGNPLNVGDLLHELVHRAQYTNREWPCWQIPSGKLTHYKMPG